MVEMDGAQRAMYELLFDEIDAAGLPGLVGEVILAAFEGEGALARSLGGSVTNRGASARERSGVRAAGEAPGIYVRSIAVEGFRGIGPRAVLRVQPGPGLTLVTGRNGSGKSSFAEAAELALTGANFRWAGRGTVWRDGWRNLHSADEVRIEVELTVEGAGGPATVTRAWAAGAGLDDATSAVQASGQPSRQLAELPWHEDLDTCRPFLSYSELGGLVTGKPSEMFDAIAAILGLDSLVDTDRRLMAARKQLDDRAKLVRRDRAGLVEAMHACPDPRAARVAAALGDQRPSRWDLDAAEAVAVGTDAGPDGDLRVLNALAGLAAPAAESVAARVDGLRAASRRVASLAGTPAEDALRVAGLLRAALDHHAAHGDGACPVCGVGGLDDTWREATGAEARRLEELARAVRDARTGLAREMADSRALLTDVPSALLAQPAWDGPNGARLDVVPARDAWRTWVQLRNVTDPATLADGLAAGRVPLTQAIDALAASARAQRDMIDMAWKPLAHRIVTWVVAARAAREEQPSLDAVTDARDWLKKTTQRLRDDRLEPFAKQSAAIWGALRQESNVELGPIRLEGATTQRKVTLDVTIDGVDGAALGVMSQGELHALGLALFLPRATVAGSPFRFVVIDDPVQAMDPAKVDGLARVLVEVAATRQVVVFTHDDRLAEAVRRLSPRNASTVIWNVVRRERSVVEVRLALDPARRCLEDAWVVATTERLPNDVKAVLVPAFCRGAIEAVCIEAFRRRQLAAGGRHQDVEDTIGRAKKTHALAALALFSDPSRGGEVLRSINNRFGRPAGDIFQLVKEGPHREVAGDLKAMVHDVKRLAEQLRAL